MENFIVDLVTVFMIRDHYQITQVMGYLSECPRPNLSLSNEIVFPKLETPSLLKEELISNSV